MGLPTMASIQKTANGKYRAQVYRSGKRSSKVFTSKVEAKRWAARQEYVIDNADEVNSRRPFSELLDRYAREVSSQKKGARPEIIRLERIGRDSIGSIALGDLSVADFASWRDRRLAEVTTGSVRRELVQISAALTKARLEWGLLSSNPIEGLEWPKDSAPRDRLPTNQEIEALRISAGEDLTNKTARAFHAFLFAIETAMRAGEIAGLTLEHVDIERRFVHLPETKNGSSRDVPLSTEAVRLLTALPEMDPVFGLTPENVSVLFVKVRNRAGVKGLRFHDSRHAAITRLAKKLHVLDLARAVGHRDIKQLMTYYNETAEDLARRLD